MKPDIIAMLADVTIQGQEADKTGPPRFDVLAYTGGILNVKGFDLPVVVDLTGLSFGKSLVANLDHDPSKRVGHVTDRSTVDGQLKLGGLASAATPARDEVVNSALSGFGWQASIEAKPGKMVELKAGKSAIVNGQSFDGPLYIARSSTLKGFAFVSHGADDNTTVTIAASHSETGTEMNEEVKKWIEAMGFNAEDLTADQVSKLTANYEGRNLPNRRTVDSSLDGILAEQKTVRAREKAIADLTATYLGEYPAHVEEIEKFAKLAIEAGWPAERFEVELLRATRPQAHTVNRRRDERLGAKVIEAAVCKAGGLKGIEDHFDEQTLDATDRHFGNGLGLQELLLISARENGCGAVSLRNTEEVLHAAFPEIRATDGFSSNSLPGILSNVANKFLLEGWMAVEDTWRQICTTRPVKDFKQVSSYSLSGDFTYQKVGPGGELKHGTLGETKYTNQADTYGRMFAITRQDLINDDLGALTMVPRRVGRGAALKLNEVFWTEFLADHATFFNTDNSKGNYQEGSTTNLQISSLTTLEQLFFDQTDPDGKPLGVLPALLLVPNALNVLGSQFTRDLEIRDNTASKVYSVSNPHAGKWNLVRSSYLSNANMGGGYSAKAFYLLANPNDMSFIEVCFLNGREAPVVETAQADFNSLGIAMRGYHDFGVKKQEYRAAAKSKGEA